MPSLEWIGKRAVINHHNEIPFRTLESHPELSAGDLESGNLIVQGDNLDALKALLPFYAGQVKLIYIDPPYNTGEENWKYNDNTNSPETRAWLEKVVGKEFEDLSRHDKWLCMMYPRLNLLKDLLRDDGIICISIDDNEIATLRILLSEIFGSTNILGTFVWKRRSPSSMGDKIVSLDHEYVLVFAKNIVKTKIYGIDKNSDEYKFMDEVGAYDSTDLSVGMTRFERPNQFFSIVNPRTGKKFDANPNRVWRFTPDTMDKVIRDNLIIWPDESDGKMERPRYKTRYVSNGGKPKPYSSWIESIKTKIGELNKIQEEFGISVLVSGMNTESSKQVEEIFGNKAFSYPKPVSLIQSFVQMATRHDDLVIDSFAGSGTTAHAILKQNELDKGNRRFILIEMDQNIAQTITKKRIDYALEHHGGGFKYCTLGNTLFDEYGQLHENIDFATLARHVYFSETLQALPTNWIPNGAFVGSNDQTGVYLLLGADLDAVTLENLTPFDGRRVVYANQNRIPDGALEVAGVVFKQIPYKIKVA